ncbi:MAG: DUF4160 domain-containing protein, partial [Acidobacteriota bacterium]
NGLGDLIEGHALEAQLDSLASALVESRNGELSGVRISHEGFGASLERRVAVRSRLFQYFSAESIAARDHEPHRLSPIRFRYFFFSREEPRIHVHVQSGDGEAKLWLEPEIELARNYRLPRKQLKLAEQTIEDRYDELVAAWRRHFGS